MVRAGLAHLTAVSGSNTSLVVAIAMAAVAGLGLGWRVRVVTCLAVLSAYVMLVRPQPSVLRAAAMGVVALVALSAGGRRRGPPALLASALVLLLVLPQFALSLGFALSFAATAGLLVVGPPIADRLGRWPISSWMPEPLRAALAVAAAAHLATLPLAILMGNGASLVALPANVLVTPLVPFATVLGLAAALVAPIASGPGCRAGHRRLTGDGGDRMGGPGLLGPAVRGRRRSRGTRSAPSVPRCCWRSSPLAAARGWRPWRDRRIVMLVVVSARARDGAPPAPRRALAAAGLGGPRLRRGPG